MSDAPELIWMPHHGEGPWFIKPVQPATEYRRADLPPTLAQAMVVPEVRELVEKVEFLLDRLSEFELADDDASAARMTRDYMGHIMPAEERARTALHRIKGETE